MTTYSKVFIQQEGANTTDPFDLSNTSFKQQQGRITIIIIKHTSNKKEKGLGQKKIELNYRLAGYKNHPVLPSSRRFGSESITEPHVLSWHMPICARWAATIDT
jgi:hypothetical protein